jgi:hypothetical protein
MRKELTLTLTGLALAAASGIAAAHGTVSFGISLGVPIVSAPVVVAPPPLVYAPPPVYYAPPRVYYAPAYYYGRPPVVIKYRHGHGHGRWQGHYR